MKTPGRVERVSKPLSARRHEVLRLIGAAGLAATIGAPVQAMAAPTSPSEVSPTSIDVSAVKAAVASNSVATEGNRWARFLAGRPAPSGESTKLAQYWNNWNNFRNY